MEAAGLGIFMGSAGFFATILEYPASPLRQMIESPIMRRIPMGLAMGLTAIGLIYSPWGKRSGAHFNPAVTLTFFRLRKIKSTDTFFYILAQFLGGICGIMLVTLFLGQTLAGPPVNFVATVPGPEGIGVAFGAEMLISFVLQNFISEGKV